MTQSHFSRRDFSRSLLLAAGATAIPAWAEEEAKFRISLAQYSLHRRLLRKDGADPLDPLDFAKVARSFGFEAVEYSNLTWLETFEEKGMPWIGEMAKRAEGEGIDGLLVMVDGQEPLGSGDPDRRTESIEGHARYFEVAHALGCDTIRVDPKHTGADREEALKLLADGVRALCERADEEEIDVLIENEAGYGADPDWLVELAGKVDHPRFGLLPDFGNFWIDRAAGEKADPVEGTRKMMPHARAVSAKSYGFEGDSRVSREVKEERETVLDYDQLIPAVLEAGYSGYIGIEYEGAYPEMEGIRQTLEVLQELGGAL